MRRAAVLTMWAMTSFARAAADTEILQASKSPSALARYIESHRNFDWRPLWRALELSDTPILPCEEPFQCATEQIKVAAPPQTVMAIHLPAGAVVYIRYFGDDRKGWRRAGAITATIKNHPPRHSVTRVGTKPFLHISTQGVSGSDMSSEVEWWLDLTRPEFEPAFAFTPQGSQHRMGFGVSRVIRATATPKVQGPKETIEVNLELEYAGLGPLGKTRYIATYQRTPGKSDFTLRNVKTADEAPTPISNQEYLELTDLLDGPTNEQLLRNALPGLKRLATTGNADAKSWLRSILENCKDTPGKRVLLDLLTRQ
jgi:hypothetical protein